MRSKTLVLVCGALAIVIAMGIWAVAGGIFDNPPSAEKTAPPSAAPYAATTRPTTRADAAARAGAEAPARAAPARAPAKGAAPGAGTPTVVVISARYGFGDAWVDVTPQVQQLVREDGLRLPRDLHKVFKADPTPGFMKYVEMSLIVNGVEMWVTAADSLQLNALSLSTTPPAETGK
jgi:hypothetical protein